jgi:hypothetical protein
MADEPQILTSRDQWILARAAAAADRKILDFQKSLLSGDIVLPSTPQDQAALAGGVNYCPDSDLKFSTFAIASPGTLPEVGDTSFECGRFYRQHVGADIVKDAAHALKAVGHSLYAANEGADADIPVWDRPNGQLVFGAVGGTQWDIAVNLYNNAVNAAKRWYVRIVIGAMTADLVPEDLEMYAGIWEKTAVTQRWLTGSLLNLTHVPIGITGTKHLNYILQALNDAGTELYSQVLAVTDAPDAFDTANDIPSNQVSYPRISFAGASGQGFTQFKIYREDVATGKVFQIADILNTNSFTFDDTGARLNMGTPLAALPAPVTDKAIAKAVSTNLQIGVYGGILMINDFTIQVPAGYDISQTLAREQYLRFGFTVPTAVARQIRIDKIYLGPTFNQYSDCPFDPLGAVASSQPTSGTPSGGGGGEPPPPGGGGGKQTPGEQVLQ